MIARIGTFLWLLLVWIVLMESVTIGSVIAGVVASGVIVAVFRFEASSADPIRIRPLRIVILMAYFTVKLAQANLHVAWAVLNPRAQTRHGIVAVPIVGSDILLAILSNGVSLTPGTSIVEVRSEPVPTLYVHVLDLHSPERTQHDILELELYIMRALGTAGAIARVEALMAAVGRPGWPSAPRRGEEPS